jgi:uncharacterized protein YbcC (UPF0753/DUF2309 family)
MDESSLNKSINASSSLFNEHDVLHRLKHYLPAQSPLKDFIHHNTLHAFQHEKFFDGLHQASVILGYNVLLPLSEYRSLYRAGKINENVLAKILTGKKGQAQFAAWKHKLLISEYDSESAPRVGQLRAEWKRVREIDIDTKVHPKLFRTVCSYLDQGIAMWNFPVSHRGFLSSLKEMERHSMVSFFRTKRARDLLLHGKGHLQDLLKIVVGDESLYEQYLFDQQFAHPGWSGMVSAIEDQPQTLLDHKKISLHEFIIFELLLEIDALEHYLGANWTPIGKRDISHNQPLFDAVPLSEEFEVLSIWQEAYEWTYYDQVLAAVRQDQRSEKKEVTKSFQAMFCIDDRECSFRRHLEQTDGICETYGTPGFFGVEFFYKPEQGKFYTKLCPAPVTPKYLIREAGGKSKQKKDLHLHKHSHSLFRGWLITQTLGLWSAVRLFFNIFKPSVGPATATAFQHMDKQSKLTIETSHPDQKENGLQVGFTVEEMATRVENLLKSIGLVKDFAKIVYAIGHGSSSVNNPHYAAYDCGACSGRPGSVNARVICFMANHRKVRALLAERGLAIPSDTQFVGGIHDTTRDEIMFFDEEHLSDHNRDAHLCNVAVFNTALQLNAAERSRRFELIDSMDHPAKVHEQVKRRSVSLFEPRPELNHATNALCIVGRRELSRKVFLDRRAFLNSYDYRIDANGNYLLSILKAAAPVCGGINLEYYFSRVDNVRLGAGTKLPHNVMGLFGVANGIDGDLRPGLPAQMIEVHDPLRLLVIVEHFPEVILDVIKRDHATYQWFSNEWVNLVAVHPESNGQYVFRGSEFVPYLPQSGSVRQISNLAEIFESSQENLPVYLIP